MGIVVYYHMMFDNGGVEVVVDLLVFDFVLVFIHESTVMQMGLIYQNISQNIPIVFVLQN